MRTPASGAALDLVHPDNYAAKAHSWHNVAGRLEQLQAFLSGGSSFEVTRSPDGQVKLDKRR
jgi:hypothetical protein